MAKPRVAVLISGRGSNMAALAEAALAPGFPAQIALVLSDTPGAAGLDKATQLAIEAGCIDRAAYGNRRAFEAALDQRLRDAGVEIICLAGFMRLLSARFVEGWGDRILNIHPSLLPAFKGLDCHARAIEAGVRFSGCTVHIVRPAMDDGPIIAQCAVPVMPSDEPDALASRILKQEHRLYPHVLELMATGRLRIMGQSCTIEGAQWPQAPLVSPTL